MITNVAKYKVIGGGKITPINVTKDECVAAITTRYGAVCYSNLISLAHYPMTSVLIEYEI